LSCVTLDSRFVFVSLKISHVETTFEHLAARYMYVLCWFIHRCIQRYHITAFII